MFGDNSIRGKKDTTKQVKLTPVSCLYSLVQDDDPEIPNVYSVGWKC